MGSVAFEGSSVVFPVLDKLVSVVGDPVGAPVGDPGVEGELVGGGVRVVAVVTVVGLGLGLGQT